MHFVDLAAQFHKLQKKINTNIQRTLEHGHYILGPEVSELEMKLADYVGVKHCITCANGTDALSIPLMVWQIGKGDAVFTSNFTFFASAEVVSLRGATPILVDIDKSTFNIDPFKLEEAIVNVLNEGKLIPKAIIPVDLFGLPAEYDKIMALAQKYNLKVLEDSAQGFGGTYKGKRTCSFGQFATTSFFPAKPLGCYGDGGAIFTNDDHFAELSKSIRAHGKGSDRYDNVRVGLNSRLDTIQAAILLAKFEVFDEEIELRNKIAKAYTDRLKDYVVTPSIPKECISVWAQYSLLTKSTEERKKIQEVLSMNNIPTMIYYPKPLHKQTVYKDLDYVDSMFEISMQASKTILCLPMHPYLSMNDINEICNKIINVIKD